MNNSPKSYLIIGGSRGIGFALSKILLNNGNSVIYASRTQNKELESSGCKFIKWDATNEDFPITLITEPLDGLVYCPGSITLKPFKSIKVDQFIADYHINVIGAVKSIQANLHLLKQTEQPSIVLFSTVAAKIGMPFHSSISAAKAAVEGLTKSIAAELAPTVRVNCIAPSLTHTDLSASLLNTPEKQEAAKNRHPLKSVGSPEDIAEAAAYLLSPESKWISGQIFHVDGGMSSLKV